MSMPTRRMAFEPALVRHLTDHGVDLEPLSKSAAFAELGTQERFYALAVAGHQALGDDLLGLKVARATPLRAFGNLAHVLLGARSLHDMVSIVLHYMRLFQRAPRAPARLAVDGALVHLIYEKPVVLPEFPNFVVDLFFGSCLESLRYVGGADPAAFELHVSYCPPDPEAYSRAFGIEVHCGATINRLIAPRAMMMAPFPDLSPAQEPLHAGFAAHLLDSQMRDGDGLKAQIRALLATKPSASVNARSIADSLAMSERTLRRRLAAEGLCLSELIDSVRAETACTYLRTLDTATVAHLLGFYDASTFSRSFRRWMGMTPACYRRQAGSASSKLH